MSDKTVVFTPEAGGSGGNGMMAMLAPLLQQKGIDPNLLVAMQGNKGNNGFGGDGSWLWIIFLFFLFPLFNRGGFGNGFGGNDGGNGGGYGAAGIPNLINNDAGRELLMSAIQGNGNAINQLASTLNCSVGQIQQSINAVTTQLQQVGNQSNMNSMQVINAIQSGNTALGQQLAQCCCDNRLAICNQTNELQNTMNANTLSLRDGATANNQAVLAKLDAMQTQALQDKIAALTANNATLTAEISQRNQNATILNSVAQQINPLVAGIQGLQSEVDAIKCKLPNTISVQYPTVRCYNPEIFQAAAAGAAYGDFAAQGLNGCGC